PPAAPARARRRRGTEAARRGSAGSRGTTQRRRGAPLPRSLTILIVAGATERPPGRLDGLRDPHHISQLTMCSTRLQRTRNGGGATWRRNRSTHYQQSGEPGVGKLADAASGAGAPATP